MKHLCILALIAGLLVLVGAGLLQSAPPQKVTGGVSFATTGSGGEKLQRWVEFEAQAGHNDQIAKGWVKYHNSNGLRFRADVQCLSVVDDWAYFSGPIVAASDTILLTRWFLFVVYDGGTPGSQGDKIFYQLQYTDPGCSPFQPPVMYDVENGNLVVH
jgi:hypothetical protein